MGLTADFFFVSFEKAELFHGSDVEYAYSLVSGCAREEVTIRRPFQSLDRVFVVVPGEKKAK